MITIKTIDVELALMRHFDFRQNLIVPNITNMVWTLAFETDMLVLTKSGYAHGFEIKVSKSDLNADFKKPQHCKFEEIKNGKSGLERYYGKFKYFSYAVPHDLKDYALTVIPEFCGLYSVKNTYLDINRFPYVRLECIRNPKELFRYKWSDKERYEIARLGAMRIYGLKQKLNKRVLL